MTRGDARHLRTKRCACGVEFAPTTGFQKHCSIECRRRAGLRTYVCQHCGEAFQRERSDRPRKFCSPRCANIVTAAARRGRPGRFGGGATTGRYPRAATCAGCGEEYQQQSRTVRHCSRSCAIRTRHRLRRAANPIKGWSVASKGETQCRACSAPATHLHHIVPRSKSRAAREDVHGNGMPLCRDCHYGWHARTVELYHDMMLDHEFAAAVSVIGGGWVEKHYGDRPAIALQRLDELVNDRVIFPSRAESFDERIARLVD